MFLVFFLSDEIVFLIRHPHFLPRSIVVPLWGRGLTHLGLWFVVPHNVELIDSSVGPVHTLSTHLLSQLTKPVKGPLSYNSRSQHSELSLVSLHWNKLLEN